MEVSQHAEAKKFSGDLLQDPRRGCAQVTGCICYAMFAYVGRFSGIISCTECIHNTIYNNANEIFTLLKHANDLRVQYHVSRTN